jgi:hypothetical protein
MRSAASFGLNFLKPVVLFCLVGTAAQRLAAQESTLEFWPQLSAYWKLSPDIQLLGTVTEHAANEPKDRDFRIGAMVLVHLPIKFHGPIARNHPEESRFLSVAGGYLYVPPAPNGTAAVENRGVFQLTGRIPWPKRFVTSNLTEMDLRWISGSFYWRYRNRLTLQRDFKVRSHVLTPYIYGEIQYYNKYRSWYGTYGAGVRLPPGKRVEMSPYFEHDNRSDKNQTPVNALGPAFSFYVRH